MAKGVDVPKTRQKPGSGSMSPTGSGLNALTIRREDSRTLTSAQEQAYVLLCAGTDRLRTHDLPAVEVIHAQVCALDGRHNGVPVVVTAAYDLLETILRNEIVDANGQCTCWLDGALKAFEIRNTVSKAIVMHSVLGLARHSMVSAQARQQIRAQFGTQRASVTPKALVAAVDSTPTLVDACVVGGVMSAAMIQDTLAAAAGLGPYEG
jgi:hypothetical protein